VGAEALAASVAARERLWTITLGPSPALAAVVGDVAVVSAPAPRPASAW
jgi:hypothetical protein